MISRTNEGYMDVWEEHNNTKKKYSYEELSEEEKEYDCNTSIRQQKTDGNKALIRRTRFGMKKSRSLFSICLIDSGGSSCHYNKTNRSCARHE